MSATPPSIGGFFYFAKCWNFTRTFRLMCYGQTGQRRAKITLIWRLQPYGKTCNQTFRRRVTKSRCIKQGPSMAISIGSLNSKGNFTASSLDRIIIYYICITHTIFQSRKFNLIVFVWLYALFPPPSRGCNISLMTVIS